ncbi:MAG: methyltransferase domain-containing protein [Chloroflexi bacterium]|nr:methyltransferase domain-containing protein [Chloroflexota bacterium]
MDEAVIRTLNDINRRFYAAVAGEFDASRQQPWEGWKRVINAFENGKNHSVMVLDVGCGNGRFGRFLAEQLGKDRLRYVGIDSSPALLERAKIALDGLESHLEQRDIVEHPPDAALGTFDLVVLFGVLHHIPGADRRLSLLRALGERVAPGGLLVFTEWRFLEVASLRERIVPWEVNLAVEAGDYLLDWRRGERALRYCHAVDDAEHARLVRAAGLRLVEEFRADAANRYTVLKNEKQLNAP